jgi:hypothetical protein
MIWRHGPNELPAKDDLVLAWRSNDDPDTTSYTIASVTDLEPIGREPGLYWLDTHWEVWSVTEETYWVPLPEAPQ